MQVDHRHAPGRRRNSTADTATDGPDRHLKTTASTGSGAGEPAHADGRGTRRSPDVGNSDRVIAASRPGRATLVPVCVQRRVRTFQRCGERDLDQRVLDALVVTALISALQPLILGIVLAADRDGREVFSPTCRPAPKATSPRRRTCRRSCVRAMVVLHGKFDGAGWHEELMNGHHVRVTRLQA